MPAPKPLGPIETGPMTAESRRESIDMMEPARDGVRHDSVARLRCVAFSSARGSLSLTTMRPPVVVAGDILIETEASELTSDPLLAPEWFLPRHTADQLPELKRNTPPSASPALA